MNKELYRENRSKGLRGQGEYPDPKGAITKPNEWKSYCAKTRKSGRRGFTTKAERALK